MTRLPAPGGSVDHDHPPLVGRAWGDGPVRYVLLHGLGVASRMVAPLARRLATDGRVLAPDQQGFGAAAQAPPHDLEDHARVVAERLQDMEGVTLIGCSLGSQIAIRAAGLLGGRLHALVLASPTVDRYRRSWPDQALRWPLELATQPPLLRKVQFEDHAAAGRQRVLRLFREALHDRPEERLGSIVVPTLVLRGTWDPLVSTRWANEIAEALPDGNLVVLPARHPMTFTESERCEREIRSFVSRSWRDDVSP